MVKSTITSKNQTTVPKEIRQRLGVGPQDVLNWEWSGDFVRVWPAQRRFLRRRGTILVGPGSSVDDVRRLRALRSREGARNRFFWTPTS